MIELTRIHCHVIPITPTLYLFPRPEAKEQRVEYLRRLSENEERPEHHSPPHRSHRLGVAVVDVPRHGADLTLLLQDKFAAGSLLWIGGFGLRDYFAVVFRVRGRAELFHECTEDTLALAQGLRH